MNGSDARIVRQQLLLAIKFYGPFSFFPLIICWCHFFFFHKHCFANVSEISFAIALVLWKTEKVTVKSKVRMKCFVDVLANKGTGKFNVRSVY